MAGLWVGLAAVAVGLPLFVLYADRRAAARAPFLAEDAWGFRTRHRLSALQMQQVERAARTGQRLDDPQLRPLAAQWARNQLHQPQTNTRNLHRWGQPALAALIIAAAIGSSVAGPNHLIPLLIALNPAVQLGQRAHRRRRLAAAITSNTN